MLKIPSALVAVPGVILTLATETAAQTFPPNLPIAVVCYAPQHKGWRVAYLYSVNANGHAVYTAPNGRLAATVDENGIVVMPVNRPSDLDCYGKTLDELRANGRVMDFQPTR
jgi:hypothetical protein